MLWPHKGRATDPLASDKFLSQRTGTNPLAELVPADSLVPGNLPLFSNLKQNYF